MRHKTDRFLSFDNRNQERLESRLLIEHDT